MESCVFCKIVAGEIPAEVVYSDERVVAFLVIEPVSEGHVVAVPRQHSDSLELASAEDAAALVRAVQAVGPMVRSALGADGFNVGINCGAAAGQEVMHTHVHVIPRWAGDGLAHWSHAPASAAALHAVAEKVRGATGS